LYNTLFTYTKEISYELDFQSQSGLGKKEWVKIVGKGWHTLAHIITNKLYNEEVFDDQYIAVIQQSFIFYQESGLKIEYTEIAILD
jgi:hypothetical protein